MDFLGLTLAPSLTKLFGHIPAALEIKKLRGDASTRSYYRVFTPNENPKSLIVMHLPADALKSDEATSDAKPQELPFLNVHRLMAARGVAVPRIYVEDVPNRILLLEDLSDETFEARLIARGKGAWEELYGEAIDLLVAMHEKMAKPEPESIIYSRGFDEKLLRWELDHFREWGVEAPYGELDRDVRADLDRRFDAIAKEVASLPRGFVHRDYQSRNLMWAPRTEEGELVVIDFQDALMGPICYDLVALLCDSYVDIPESLQLSMIARYADKRGLDRKAFTRAFWLQTVQRKLKDAGRFVFIDRVRANPDFLPWFAPSLVYVGRALKHLDGLEGLDALLKNIVPGFPDRAQTPPLATGKNSAPTSK
ncbi:MAG: phosphotransferase [Sandaracinaceae bacterium]|nr:phosphotransferase [Sandaracinaceae bacterium]